MVKHRMDLLVLRSVVWTETWTFCGKHCGSWCGRRGFRPDRRSARRTQPRAGYRNGLGHRHHGVAIPKLREGSYFPSLLEPREKALCGDPAGLWRESPPEGWTT